MKKRIISLLLVLVLAIGICPAAFAAEVGTETAEVEAVVENYLRDSVHNMFFWKEAEKDIVIPTTFTTNASSSELRLWADLHNALPSGTTATLKGYANQKAYSWSMEITKPSGLKLYKSQLGDGSTVSTTHIFNEVGLWTVVLKANNASGTQKTFTYMVRIY